VPRPLRWILELAFGVVAGLLVYGLVMAVVEAREREHDEPLRLLDPQQEERRPAPDFELRDRHGEVYRLSDFAGRPVVLNLWSIDCPPCVEEFPSLIRLSRVARERGTFSVVTVCVEGSWDDVREHFPGGQQTDLLVLFDPEREIVERAYGTERFPETFLIDSGGDIRARFDGRRDWASPVVWNLLESL